MPGAVTRHTLRTRTREAIAVALLVLPVQALASHDASTWQSRIYRVSDGLPSAMVYAIQQDARGYLWLGTALGLIRFDGTEFIEWNTDGTTTLPGDDVMALRAARDGSLWMGFAGAGGISRLLNGRLVNYPAGRSIGGDGSVSALLDDRQGRLWCGSSHGLSRFVSGTWELLGGSHGLPRASVISLYEDHGGDLWVGTTVGVFRTASSQDRFDLVTPAVVNAFAEDSAGVMWVAGPEPTFHALTPSSPSQTGRTATHGIGQRLLYDSDGNLWVGTTRGLLKVRPVGGAADAVPLTGHDGLEDEEVLALVQDREGNIWVGSRGGLRRFFVADVTVLTNNRGLIGNGGALTTTRDGTVWVGTNDGVSAFSPHGGAVAVQHHLPGVKVSGLHGDAKGALWLGTDGAVATLANGRMSWMSVTGGAMRGQVRALTSDTDGNLWLCQGQLSRWRNGVLTELTGGAGAVGSLCTSLGVDPAGRVWVGFVNGGIAAYHDGRFRWYSEAAGLPPGPIVTLYVDNVGTVWAATHLGVTRVKDDRLVTLDDQHGLPGKEVTAIVDDEEGNLWLGLSAGIVRLAKSEFDRIEAERSYRVRYELYDSTDGLLDAPGIQSGPTATRGGDGRLWFQTVKGVAIVDPARVGRQRKGVSIRIDDVIVDGHSVGPSVERISLPPRVRAIEFDYGAVSLSAASKVRFSYFLEGFDTGWVAAGVRRKAFYTNLPPRAYTFHVRAEMYGADRAVVTQALTVLPAFYQERWFYAVCASVVLLAGWAIWQLRLRALRREFAAATAERTRIGREIHDTILQSMVGVAMHLGAIEKKLTTSVPDGREELRRIQRRLKEYIYDARQSILMLRAAEPHPTLPEALREFLEDLGKEGRQGIRLNVTGQPDQGCSDIERELLRIAQEALRNACEHGRAGAVRVDLEYSPTSIRLHVADDGCGFDVDERRSDQRHWGLVGMEERARGLGGRLSIDSQPGHGTDIDVTVPRVSPA